MKHLIFFFFATALLAQDNPPAADRKPNAADVAAGKSAFRQNCGFCHGLDARGASGPDLIRSTLVNHDVNGNLISEIVHNGRPEKGMPAFSLPAPQVLAIAEFLHTEASAAASVARRVPTEYPVEKLLVGNAQAGKAYFDGEGGCTVCHSVTGNLAHIATKYKPIDLQSRIAFPSGASPRLTVTEPSGKSVTGDQVYSDEFAVSLRAADGWVYSWQRNSVKVEAKDPLAAHEKLLGAYSDKALHDLFAYLETLK